MYLVCLSDCSILQTNMLTLNYALVQDVAQITNDMVGEGTTPATVLVNAIYSEAL
jgi:chaperonin GroEL (HSP60 family)